MVGAGVVGVVGVTGAVDPPPPPPHAASVKDAAAIAATIPAPPGSLPHPMIILKGHDDKLREHEGGLNDVSNRINQLSNRIDKLEGKQATVTHMPTPIPISTSTPAPNPSSADSMDGLTAAAPSGMGMDMEDMDGVFENMINNRSFISSIVETIMTDTNISEIIGQIDPIIHENRELRALLHSQQEMLNHMNALIYKLLTHAGATVEVDASAIHDIAAATITDGEGFESGVVNVEEEEGIVQREEPGEHVEHGENGENGENGESESQEESAETVIGTDV